MKIAATREGVTAATEMGHKVMAVSRGVEKAYCDINITFNSVKGDLGDLEDLVSSLMQQGRKTIDDVRDATQDVPNLYFNYAEKLNDIVRKN